MKKDTIALFQVTWGYLIMAALLNNFFSIFMVSPSFFALIIASVLVFRVNFSKDSNYVFAFQVELRFQLQNPLNQG